MKRLKRAKQEIKAAPVIWMNSMEREDGKKFEAPFRSFPVDGIPRPAFIEVEKGVPLRSVEIIDKKVCK